MKKVLMISHDFPPIQSVEGVRSMKFTKYFPKFGWGSIVLCAKEPAVCIVDDTHLSESSSDIDIYRTYSLENIISKGIAIYLGLSDKFVWIPFAIRMGKKIFKKEDINVIVSRSTPVTSHLVAYKLKLHSGLPWIADFSDPWTQNPYVKYPSRIIQRFDEHLEQKVIYMADKITFTAERTRAQFLDKYKDIPENKVITIPNFYDPDDFIKPKDITKSDKFTITYAGGFYGIRTPEPFFRALELLKEENGDINGNIKVKIIGKMGGFEHLISKYGLEDIIQIIAPMPHKDVFYHLYSSNILLLIDAPVKPSIFLPTKLLEYIYTGKPILAITPEDGESADVIRSTKTGVVVSPDNIEGIKDAILYYYEQHKTSELVINPDWNEIQKYSAENCTKKLVGVIKELT